ncbi:peptidoglycan D,D-transpeptidase FtsI family protein [Williamsia sterculiae]|uniref:Cell elongation-specific peptidoglycan D,D-transpeptidase n=1 Tax=Williamsia sterculiae TaxID=1344003 RepID=A0A1N7FEP8_9NOCA|nr:penicillin-binding protein 2 [Williamsia sterculiae]SIR98783.1 cell elongation-specific peptidoglycan D,D-transpeptidase [Williamsia sterculiae]
MNVSIRRVVMVVMAMVVLLLLNATYVQVFKADKLRNDPRNNRVLLDEYSRQRGQITGGTDLLAQSIPTEDRLKYLRSYPNGNDASAYAFAPATGYFSFQYGSSGLEQAEDSILNGNDDRLFGQRFVDMFSGRDPRGGNVVTTINPRAQQVAYDAMQKGCSGGCRGAVVALAPSTGAILAMVSTPSYDPNKLATHDADEREKAWNSWTNDRYEPMLNRAINQTYPPGSTFKMITTSAALGQGVDENTRLTASNTITLPDTVTPLTNYGSETCPNSSGGTVSLHQALQYSCNTAFVQLATEKLRNPIDSFKRQASAYGIDTDTPNIPLDVSDSTVGQIPDLAALGQSAIGQRDVRITPLQNAMVAATIANGGVRMQPYLVDKLQSPDLKTLQTTRPQSVNEPITPQVAATLTQMMIDSEKNTSGSGGAISIASKTGTAEHSASSDAADTPYAWYIAFGPSSNAQVAVAVIVENGDRGVQSTGGSSAAPIGRAVINSLVGGNG